MMMCVPSCVVQAVEQQALLAVVSQQVNRHPVAELQPERMERLGNDVATDNMVLAMYAKQCIQQKHTHLVASDKRVGKHQGQV
jgi:hypothetical protein